MRLFATSSFVLPRGDPPPSGPGARLDLAGRGSGDLREYVFRIGHAGHTAPIPSTGAFPLSEETELNDVMATFVGSAPIREVRANRRSTTTPSMRPGPRPAPAAAPVPSRCAREHWSTTLSEDDLENLLQILEADLIPQLLSSYSPASPRASQSEPSSE